jgi:hypothetical protein
MAAVTADKTGNLAGIAKWFQFTAGDINDGTTFEGPATGAYWFQQTDNPTTQASAGISIARSTTTYTFYPGENGATGYLFVENRLQ